ncbi:MAG: hypothetical protein ABSE84_15025 [Isosphaeraceae bacterium]
MVEAGLVPVVLKIGETPQFLFLEQRLHNIVEFTITLLPPRSRGNPPRLDGFAKLPTKIEEHRETDSQTEGKQQSRVKRFA